MLVLKIREGVYLLVEDKILDVLFSNEEVMVFVEFWDLLVLFERYRDVCINVNISKWLLIFYCKIILRLKVWWFFILLSYYGYDRDFIGF